MLKKAKSFQRPKSSGRWGSSFCQDIFTMAEFLCRTFIHAGHETTTSAICRTLHLLSLHPDVQDKLRTEVSEARTTHGDLDYDILMGLPYLDAVCRETLRVYPPVPTLIRV